MKGKEDQILEIICSHVQVTKNDIIINKAAMVGEIAKRAHEHYMRFNFWVINNLVSCLGGWTFLYGDSKARFKDREEVYQFWLNEVEVLMK